MVTESNTVSCSGLHSCKARKTSLKAVSPFTVITNLFLNSSLKIWWKKKYANYTIKLLWKCCSHIDLLAFMGNLWRISHQQLSTFAAAVCHNAAKAGKAEGNKCLHLCHSLLPSIFI